MLRPRGNIEKLPLFTSNLKLSNHRTCSISRGHFSTQATTQFCSECEIGSTDKFRMGILKVNVYIFRNKLDI